ncbi:TPA: hypothetical protein DDW35_02580 [Candidatus Sumerlaeota bacterium]|jgi:hypothetical protein|nr:hypothetical protein [Candidatus Sumerlaeota bacterium]
MVFIEFIEYLIILFVALGMITEVVIPTIRDRPLFPHFHRKKKTQAEILSHLSETAEEISKMLEEAEKTTFELPTQQSDPLHKIEHAKQTEKAK